MIISQTPLRVSFFGGGTDIDDYYKKYGGAVLSAAIDKYIYIIVKSRYDGQIILNYSEREKVSDVSLIKHHIFREALLLAGIHQGIEITSIADIPSEGSGLGSSSSFTVGLLNALFTYKGEAKNAYELAAMACEIEIDRLGEPIGKQDQYAAAFGGFKNFFFNPDDTVDVSPITIPYMSYHQINAYSMLFYTGITRQASKILIDQKANTSRNIKGLHTIKELAVKGRKHFTNLNIEMIGSLLDTNWEVKKTLSERIRNEAIDNIYALGKQAGAYGGKLLGAGGGGFFIFLCPPEHQEQLRTALNSYQELPFSFENFGSRILLNVQDDGGFISRK